MKLNKLTIHNLATIGDAELDFCSAPLDDAPIFLICGDTGAGKTTILDGICLALFGDSPRMSSLAKRKETIDEFEGDKDSALKVGDPRHLLRRGTGEGFAELCFTGNDGKVYCSKWVVFRAHNKAHKHLMPVSRSLKAEDNSFSETRISEINQKITEVTGLDYTRFCRTAMLAQGEFTKFLKSDPKEKADILEKLTGTEIYSRIGFEISNRHSAKKEAYQNLKSEVEKTSVLDEKLRGELETSMTDLSGRLAVLVDNRKILDAKIAWLVKEAELTREYEQAVKKKADAIRILEGEAYRRSANEIEQHDRVRNLIVLSRENEKMQGLANTKTALLPALKSTIVDKEEALKKCNEAKDKIAAEIAGLETSILALNPEKVTEQLHSATTRDRELGNLETQIVKSQSCTENVSKAQKDIDQVKANLDLARNEIAGLTGPLAEAEALKAQCDEAFKKMELSGTEVVKSLRAQLDSGDICPVCGQEIARKLEDSVFENLLEPLQKDKEIADDKVLKLRTQHQTAKRIIEAETGNLIKAETSLAKAKQAEEKAVKILDQMTEACGVADVEKDSLPNVVAECRKELAQTIAEIKKVQKNIDSLQKALDAKRKEERVINADYEKTRTDKEAACNALNTVETEIRTINERLEGNAETIESELNLHGLSRQRFEELASLSDDHLASVRRFVQGVLNDGTEADAVLRSLDDKLAKVNDDKPQYEEGEDKETLDRLLSESDNEIAGINRSIGEVKTKLSQDDEARKHLGGLRLKMEEARDEFSKWEGLYNLFGDKNGAHFRTIAQSYVLGRLLDNANVYMRSFTDRYTLTCNDRSLAILVKDATRPGDAQPASILSGGESFMASLSLALALANLRQAGAEGVDILFIDEGFGTLSPEFLNNVMDTLGKLHKIGGKRIGLISHVTEMRERIPVHVNVVRDSPGRSSVTVNLL